MLPPLSTAVISFWPDEHHGAEAEDEGQQVEEADEARRLEDRVRARPRVGHGVEAHQDVRQARRCRTSAPARARWRPTGWRRACPGASTPAPYRLGRRLRRAQRVACRTARSTRSASTSAPPSKQHRLHDLHPGRGDHAAEEHVGEHDAARRSRPRSRSRVPNMQLDQVAGSHHLRDQVEDDDRRAFRWRRRCAPALAQAGRRRRRRRCTCRGCATARRSGTARSASRPESRSSR